MREWLAVLRNLLAAVGAVALVLGAIVLIKEIRREYFDG
jgi:hypothetical protein